MDYSFEISAREKGFTAVCGIDEAGRGPLAGPVYASFFAAEAWGGLPDRSRSRKAPKHFLQLYY